METPRDRHESKRFRWVGRPSEEELLGVPGSTARRTPVSPVPRSASAPAPVRAELVDPLEAAPKWRFQARDLIAIAAIAAAVWFAVRGSEGLPFHHSGSPAAAEDSDQVAARVTLDGHSRSAIRRAAATRAAAPTSTTGKQDGGGAGSGGSGSKGDPKPGDTSEPPLVQATIPGVGTVTVPQSDLTDDPADALPLPDSAELTSGTPTLPLP